MSRRLRLSAVLFTLTLLVPTLGFGDETAENTKMRDRVVTLSKLKPEQVDALRSQNYGWGEILHVGGLVAKGVSYDSILSDRASGMGWGEIAKKHGFKMGDIQKSINAEMAAAKKADKAAAKEIAKLERETRKLERMDRRPERPGRPEKPEKPGRSERPEKPEKRS